MTIGPSMANIVAVLRAPQGATALSVSPNPLHRNPAYEPIDQPGPAIRAAASVQYLVWDAFSARRVVVLLAAAAALRRPLPRPRRPHRDDHRDRPRTGAPSRDRSSPSTRCGHEARPTVARGSLAGRRRAGRRRAAAAAARGRRRGPGRRRRSSTSSCSCRRTTPSTTTSAPTRAPTGSRRAPACRSIAATAGASDCVAALPPRRARRPRPADHTRRDPRRAVQRRADGRLRRRLRRPVGAVDPVGRWATTTTATCPSTGTSPTTTSCSTASSRRARAAARPTTCSGSPARPATARTRDRVPPGGFDDLPTIFDRLAGRGHLLEVLRRRTTTRRDHLPHATGPRPRPAAGHRSRCCDFARFLDDPALASAHRRPDRVLHATSPRHAARRRLHRRRRRRASTRPAASQAGQRLVRALVGALMRSRALVELGVPVDLRRLGRLVRPRARRRRSTRTATASGCRRCWSARTRSKGHVDHTTLDFTRSLRFIENNWGLAPLAEPRRRSAHEHHRRLRLRAPPRAAALVGLERAPEGRPAAPLGRLRCYCGALASPRPAALLLAAPPADRRRGRAPGRSRTARSARDWAALAACLAVAPWLASRRRPARRGRRAACRCGRSGRGDDHPGDAEPHGRVARTVRGRTRGAGCASRSVTARPAHRRDVRRRRAARLRVLRRGSHGASSRASTAGAAAPGRGLQARSVLSYATCVPASSTRTAPLSTPGDVEVVTLPQPQRLVRAGCLGADRVAAGHAGRRLGDHGRGQERRVLASTSARGPGPQRGEPRAAALRPGQGPPRPDQAAAATP